VIGCCDSRVSPEVIFDAGPGELFVVRNVANLVPVYQPDGGAHGVSAALEYAVNVLRIKHIVVLGHAQCGGIRAFIDNAAPLSPGDFIGRWMAMFIKPGEKVGQREHETRLDFTTRIEKAAVLAIFLPLILSSGGNSGSQATTLIIRAMALRHVELRDWWRVFKRELASGFLLGISLASLGFLRILAWQWFGLKNYGPHFVLLALTIGGSLVHADPASELPACMQALGAEVVLRGPSGERRAIMVLLQRIRERACRHEQASPAEPVCCGQLTVHPVRRVR